MFISGWRCTSTLRSIWTATTGTRTNTPVSFKIGDGVITQLLAVAAEVREGIAKA